jgi:simple sugar transport system ATP-binding protein
MEALLELKGVSVIYPSGVTAVSDASLKIYRGEVLALLGENGAGKTTLAKVISGVVRPSSGEIYIDGARRRLSSYRDAVGLGIYMVPQTPQLFGNLSVLEDLRLSLKLSGYRGGFRNAIEGFAGALRRLGAGFSIESRCSSLSMGERQKVEIAKAIILGRRLAIFDEPSVHLTPSESRSLGEIVRELARSGRSVIYITHKISEAMDIADRIAIMRGGRIAGIIEERGADFDTIVRQMFGDKPTINSQTGGFVEHSEVDPGGSVLEIRDLWVPGNHGGYSVRGVSLSIRAGEILGIAGIAGNGQRELFEVLSGLRKPARGSIILDGEDITNKGQDYRIRRGLSLVPEERLGWGLVPGLSIAMNIAISIEPGSRGFFIDWRSVDMIALEIINSVGVKARSTRDPVDILSGGNMQKLMVARELYRGPRVIVAMNPTGGLDIATARFVRRLITDYSRKAGALIISEDLDELIEICDRIAVMSRGSIRGLFTRPFDYDEIARSMIS